MPLSMIHVGQKGRVMRISGPEASRKHLGALGFVPGAFVTVVTSLGGSLIVAIHDSRIAVNDDVSRNVFVEPV